MNTDSSAKDIADLKRLAELPALRGQSARVSVDQGQLARVVALAEQGVKAKEVVNAAEEFLAAYDESYVEGGPANLVSSEDRLVAAIAVFLHKLGGLAQTGVEEPTV